MVIIVKEKKKVLPITLMYDTTGPFYDYDDRIAKIKSTLETMLSESSIEDCDHVAFLRNRQFIGRQLFSIYRVK